MKLRSKLGALLGAGLLTLGIAGAALATDLLDGQVGKTLGSFTQSCDGNFGEIGPGQVGVHFVLNQTDATSGHLDATFSNPDTTVTDVPNGDPQTANVLHFWVVITGDANTVIESASTDVDGGNLVVSHVCFGEGQTTSSSSSSTSFTSSQSGESSSSSSSSSESSSTSFTGSQSGETSSSLPNTATIGQTSGPTDHSWILIAALGMLLGSALVLAPARAKNRR